MDALIAILMYINVVVPNHSYTIDEINEIEMVHYQEIIEIQNDANLTNHILDEYQLDVDRVIIWDNPMI